MSPITEKNRTTGVAETRYPGMVAQPGEAPARASDDVNREAVQRTPEEALAEEEKNPWRNHEDDQHKWLGFLLAAVGFGAIGYLIGGV